jgi:N-acetylglutamate synthase-like GNAT family acetyltransferase
MNSKISKESIKNSEIQNEKIFYRRANINDIKSLVEYRIQFLNELYDPPGENEIDFIKKKLENYFYKKIQSKEFIAWLAEQKGIIVGTSGMVVWQLPSRYGGLESGKIGYILNLYTLPEKRRKGICTRLLKELIQDAKLIGLKYLHLHASKYGENLYKKIGFKEPDHKELFLKLK